MDYTPTADTPAGAAVVVGELLGVARTAIAANQPGSLALEGVFSFPKPTGAGTGFAKGVKAHWKAATSTALNAEEAGQTIVAGKTVAAAGDGDATVSVRLTQER